MVLILLGNLDVISPRPPQVSWLRRDRSIPHPQSPTVFKKIPKNSNFCIVYYDCPGHGGRNQEACVSCAPQHYGALRRLQNSSTRTRGATANRTRRSGIHLSTDMAQHATPVTHPPFLMINASSKALLMVGSIPCMPQPPDRWWWWWWRRR